MLAAIFIAMSLAGCGGGGGGDDSGSALYGPGGSTTPATQGSVTITPKGPVTGVGDLDQPYTAVLEGTWKATNLASGSAVYLKVADTSDVFQMPAVQPAPAGGTFRFELAQKSNAPAGRYTGQFEITPCRDAACAQTWGAPVRVDYQLDVAGLGEWETLGRDASHASSVATRIDPTRLQQAWEWTAPQAASAVESWVARPATTGGSLVVLAGSTMGDGSQRGTSLLQLNETTGALRSTVTIDDNIQTAAPGSNGRLAYLTRFGSDELLTAYDGAGNVAFRYMQPTDPLALTLAPSHRDGVIYFFGGFNGGEVHAADANTGARLWATPRVGLESATPTVDANYVYYHASSGGFGTIEMLDRRTGAHVASIIDPSSDGTRPLGSNAVALGSRGNLISRSFRGLTATRLSSFNIADRQWEWTTSFPYSQFFAVSGGVIYAIRAVSGTPTLDAIDETNGQVLWSWAVPVTDGQSGTFGNIVATQNTVFFGTQSAGGATSWVWAVDTEQRKLAWRVPDAGYIVISGSRTVYLMSGPAGGIMNRVRAMRMQ